MQRVFPVRDVRNARGITLIELIIAIAIIGLLAGAAVPIVRVRVKRDKEVELRRDLWEMRDAIDRYKDAADRNAFQTKVGVTLRQTVCGVPRHRPAPRISPGP